MPSLNSSKDWQESYLEELVGSSDHLKAMSSAAQAEGWVSGVVTEWILHGGDPQVLAAGLVSSEPVLASMVAWLLGADVPVVDAEWANDVGRHEFGASWLVVGGDDPAEASSDVVIIEWRGPSGEAHDVVCTIRGNSVVELSLSPGGLAASISEDPESGFWADAQPPDVIMPKIAEALKMTTFDALDDTSALNLLLLRRRFEISSTDLIASRRDASPIASASADDLDDVGLPERDVEADLDCADVLTRSNARAGIDPTDVPQEAAAVLADVLRGLKAGESDALASFTVAFGVPWSPDADLTISELAELACAYLYPKSFVAHTTEEQQALARLENIDWLGIAIGLQRARVGLPIDGSALVDMINRCPELSTSIPASDQAEMAWTLERMLYCWQVCGVLDDEGRLTALGSWLVPVGTVLRLRAVNG